MAKLTEIMLQTCPMKTIIRPSSIELWVKRPNKDWTRAVSIKAAKNNIYQPWSIRYYEFGVAKYGKFATWKDVKEDIAIRYFVELPDEISDKVLAKITMIKMVN